MSAQSSAFLSIIRPMREPDIAEVARIEQAAYDYPWSPRVFRDCLRMRYDCTVHLDDGRIVGYLLLAVAGGEAHVLNLAVNPARQREGFGRRLLRRAVRYAPRLSAQRIFLEVRPSNHGALRLYINEGFTEVGRRRDYYMAETGREDALVLRRELSGAVR